jgi:hypothetical protein
VRRYRGDIAATISAFSKVARLAAFADLADYRAQFEEALATTLQVTRSPAHQRDAGNPHAGLGLPGRSI